MRVKFVRDYSGAKGELPYAKGDVVDLDQGLADQLVADGYAKAFPRTQAEIDEAVTKYYPGDEYRTPKQLAHRIPQVVALTGDTRAATEAELGEDDPHVVRAELVEAAAEAVKETARAAAVAKKDEAKARTEAAAAEAGAVKPSTEADARANPVAEKGTSGSPKAEGRKP
jgi:hypothetical protein